MQNENFNTNIMNRQGSRPGQPVSNKVMMEPGGIRAKRPSG